MVYHAGAFDGFFGILWKRKIELEDLSRGMGVLESFETLLRVDYETEVEGGKKIRCEW